MNTVFKVLSYVERELIRPIRHAERLNKPKPNLHKEDWDYEKTNKKKIRHYSWKSS